MRKQLLSLLFVPLLSLMTACGGGGGEKKTSVKVSAAMQDFMNNFNGLSASVVVALEKYCKPGCDTKDMGLYNLEKPVVLEAKGECYLLECKSGITKRKYNICWEGDKIASIEDRGME